VPDLRRVLLLSLVVLAGCGSTASQQGEELQSLAAEGALLAHDVREGDAWRPYTRAHTAELAEQASSLRSAAKDRRVRLLARVVARQLELLANADRRQAAQIETRLTRILERIA
jgi:hypothetical protein